VLKGAVGQDLAVYTSDAARLRGEEVNPELPIGAHGGPDDPLVVVVSPRILDAPIPGMELQRMQINAAEYQLDKLNGKVGTLIPTPGLHKLWRVSGELLRPKEEVVLWTVRFLRWRRCRW
jgi:hypothetical protein